jgi:uncharacterized protein (DUF4415 family)
MSEHVMNKLTVTDLATFDAITDEQIDTSDIPPLSEEFFTEAEWQMPLSPIRVTIEIEPDILAWFQAQGEGYQHRLAAALRLYVEAHRSIVKEAQAG